MARTLAPIPQGVAIADKDGGIADFMRFRWQELLDGFGTVPIAGSLTKTGQTAALATTAVLTVLTGGWYEMTTYARVTTPDGVSSSLTVTVGWTENGQALTQVLSALTGDSVTTVQPGPPVTVWADVNTDITVSTAYASNTPNKMAYKLLVIAKHLA